MITTRVNSFWDFPLARDKGADTRGLDVPARKDTGKANEYNVTARTNIANGPTSKRYRANSQSSAITKAHKDGMRGINKRTGVRLVPAIERPLYGGW